MKTYKHVALDDSGNSDSTLPAFVFVVVAALISHVVIRQGIAAKDITSPIFLIAFAAAPVIITLLLWTTIQVFGPSILLTIGGTYNLVNRKSAHKWSTQDSNVFWAFRIVYDVLGIPPAETVRTGSDSPTDYYALRRYEKKGHFKFGEGIYPTPTNPAELRRLMRHCHTPPTSWRPRTRPTPTLIRAVALTNPRQPDNRNYVGHANTDITGHTETIKNNITRRKPQTDIAATLVGYHYSDLSNWETYNARYGHVQHGWLLPLAGITPEEAEQTQPDAETLKLLATLQGHPIQEINELLAT